ncbi:MAG: protease modulator HflC [Gammaproteobacteria bacterium]|nr:protease modulator HflC [Gammaproteobacteria bacterium]
MNKAYLVGLIILLALGAMSIFTVDEREKALKLQLGKIERADYEPGLHFKLPYPFENVLKFDARIQNQDSDPQNYLTVEKKNVKVDSFVKWRVKDVAKYYTSTGGSVTRTNDRLAAVILKRLKDEFGKRTIQQVVSGERTEIMDKLRSSVKQQADELGIEIIDARIKRVDLPPDVSQSVFDRMGAERKEVAKKFRSEGEERAKQIRAEADRDREVILANAERDAQKIRGDGDGRATEIFANAFTQDANFYSLYRTLNAYKNTFNNPSDVLLVEPSTQFFQYFKGDSPGR